MRILHYFLGFPPYRTGGMIAFCMDLMRSQLDNGHDVSALWPGAIPAFNKKVRIVERKKVDGIRNFELISPLPVPLDEGIVEPQLFMQACEKSEYTLFFKRVCPDIIHVHTLMGLHKEFFEEANYLKIKTIYTTHDYYGLCPKVTFYHNGNVCEFDQCHKKCAECNQGCLSYNKILLLQSPIYRALKDSFIVKQLRKRHRKVFFEDDYVLPKKEIGVDEIQAFKDLRTYYIEILNQISLIHCNSSIAREVYSRFIDMSNSKIITISNSEIRDNRSLPNKESKKFRIVYLAPPKSFKGYNVLIKALDELWKTKQQDFELHIYSEPPLVKPYMMIHRTGFKRNELSLIFSEADVLIAPSIWYETFGFTVLEALSYGVPVIVSDHVGAKDIIGEGGIIVPANSVEEMVKAISKLTPEKIMYLKNKIRSEVHIKDWKEFVNEFEQLINNIVDHV